MRDDLAADHRQTDRGAEPGAVPDELATAHGVGIGHDVTTTVPCMVGWIEQMYS